MHLSSQRLAVGLLLLSTGSAVPVVESADLAHDGPVNPQLRPRINGACSRYPTAYKSITACATGAQFCSSYLGHDSTTVVRTFITKTAPAISTETVYTSTETDYTTVTTGTNTVTAAAESVTSTVSDAVDTVTISFGDVSTTIWLSTVTSYQCAPTPPVVPASPSKRALEPLNNNLAVAVAAAKAGPSCGLRGFPAQTVSGACACLNAVSTSTVTIRVAARTTTLTTISTTTSTISTSTDTTITPTSSLTVTVTQQSVTIPSTTVTITISTSVVTSTKPRATDSPRFHVSAFSSGRCDFDGYYPNLTTTYPDGHERWDWVDSSSTNSGLFYLDANGTMWEDRGCTGEDKVFYTNFIDYTDYYWYSTPLGSVPQGSDVSRGCSIDASTLELTCPDGAVPGYFYACCTVWRHAAQVATTTPCTQFRIKAIYLPQTSPS